MNKKFLIIGNWKMYKTFSETLVFLDEFARAYKKTLKNKEYKDIIENNDFAIAAPFTSLPAFKAMNKIKKLQLAAQNISHCNDGALTGDISGNMLVDLDVEYVILGHSERRKYHHETNDFINMKAKQAIEYGLKPILCVGETLEEYETGKTKEVIEKQIKEGAAGINPENLIIAYEPNWAVGTGKVATPEIVQDICSMIRKMTSPKTIIQYGGSVKPENIYNLSLLEDVNGFLIGGASLEVNSFIKLLTLGHKKD